MAIRPVLFAILMLVLLPQAADAATTDIIVKREPGLSTAERRDIRADAGVRYVESLPLARTEVVAARPGDVPDAVRDLNAHPDVAYAERDRPIRAFSDDPHFGYLWGLENAGDFSIGGIHAVADADMDVTDAWAETVGTGRTVAVVDSGVDATHPDLAGRVLPGWDFVGGDPFAGDLNGHGTHVAGTIAATRDNGKGIAGVAPGARILPLRVLDGNGEGSVSDAIKAYDFAAGQGVSIVNLSLGGKGVSQAEQESIASHPDLLFVVAAGNDGTDNDGADPDYPCAYPLPNIVCVGASEPDDKPAPFSNFGANRVDVFAPGYSVYSTVPGGGYDFKDGTSMATPHIAGAAALLLSRLTKLSPAAVRKGLVDFSDPGNPSLVDKSVSDGRANVNDTLLNVDADGDGTPEITDTCPGVANPDQDAAACGAPPADRDGDGVVAGDLCPDEPVSYATNGCPGNGPDGDADAWPDSFDVCPTAAGTARGCPDGDRDGVRDTIDNCPTVANPSQANADRRADGGDACDRDLDNDGRANTADNCPTTSNATQANLDRDRYGDACDADRDGDGRANTADACPDVKALTANGCPVAPQAVTRPADRDGDGRPDATDACPVERAASADGCPLPALTALSVKTRRRSLTVRLTTSRPATVRVRIERKKHGRWVRVKGAQKYAANGATVRLRRARPGRYRVKVSLWSGAGAGVPATRRFRVR